MLTGCWLYAQQPCAAWRKCLSSGTANASGVPLLLLQIGLAENCGIHARRMRLLLLGRLQCHRVLDIITCAAGTRSHEVVDV